MNTPQQAIRLGSARELASEYTMLLSSTQIELPSALVYSNLDKFDPMFARHHHQQIYPRRTAKITEVGLVTWPPGTTLLATEGFPTFVGDMTVDEQLSPWLRENPDRLENLRTKPMDIVDVDHDCWQDSVKEHGGTGWGKYSRGPRWPSIFFRENLPTSSRRGPRPRGRPSLPTRCSNLCAHMALVRTASIG